MKKLLTLSIAFGIAATLTACGGSYRKTQTLEEQTMPMSCVGLHTKHAQWHFTDDFGQQVDVSGACHAGKKHGQFEFIVAGKKIAVTKFVKDEEIKTACSAGGEKTRLNLENCMRKNASLNAQATPAEAPAAPVVEETAAEDAE